MNENLRFENDLQIAQIDKLKGKTTQEISIKTVYTLILQSVRLLMSFLHLCTK